MTYRSESECATHYTTAPHEVSESVHAPHVSWLKASKHDLCNYRFVLDLKWRGIILPTEALLCNGLTCNKVEHLRYIYVFAGELSEACISAANVSILFSCDRTIAGHLTGWSERVQPLRVKSLFRHRMWVLKETVTYYVQNQNPVFCTFLDSTKAFDRVNYCELFKLLVKRELPVLVIRVLANL